MQLNPDDLRKQFDRLSDEALLEVDRDDLVDLAREIYDAELSARGLGRHAEKAPVVSGEPELVPVAVFMLNPAEAQIARALLEAAEIPCYLENEYTLNADRFLTGVVGGERLLVPPDFLDRAREVLASSISDEDLAAQSEAAGPLTD